MSAPAPLLVATGLHHRLGGRPVLQGIDLAVVPGERVALVGPNGAGKSTLLRCLAGRLRPDRGTVVLAGRPVAAWDRQALARRRAVLSQQPPGALAFTAAEVVAMGRSPHGRRGEAAAVARALARTETTALADRPLGQLSGGERQRVHLARVLAQLDPGPPGDRPPAPTLLLLDEPTNTLDPRHQQRVLALAGAHARGRAGGACVAVLHDLNLAAGWADRVVLLHAGRVQVDGPPAVALAPVQIQRAFQLATVLLPHPQTGRPVLVPSHPEQP